ncbi:Heat shock 70 kDa protein [Verticillium dahliae VDG1]|nr:Heat shock 70 kDa protein [Verticillium dahliae VDG1]
MATSEVRPSLELRTLDRPDFFDGTPLGAATPDAALGETDLPAVTDTHDPADEFESLPPADEGKHAHLFLAACFLVEALIWGFPFSFGVFRSYYATHAPFAGAPNIAVIGTCAMGIMYFTAPLVISVLRVVPRFSRWSPVIGLLLTCFALAMSSFSTTVPHLIATQGVFYAMGGALAYIPCIVYMDEWFVRRKGLAYGIMWSGTGIAGVIFPLLMETLLSRFGHRTTLRLWAGLLFLLAAPLAFFIRPRIPPTSARSSSAAFRRPHANTFLGAAPFAAASTLLFVNVASVFGCVAMGHMVDRLPVGHCLLVSSIGAAVGCLMLWGFASNLPVLYVFCAVYGLLAGSYTSAWPGVMTSIVEREKGQGRGVDPILVFGCLASGRGVGNMVSGPLSEALIEGKPWMGDAAFGYGSGYGTLIVFTGVTAALGGMSWLWKRIGWMK